MSPEEFAKIVVVLGLIAFAACVALIDTLQSKFKELVEFQAEAFAESDADLNSLRYDPTRLIQDFGLVRGYYIAKLNHRAIKRAHAIREANASQV